MRKISKLYPVGISIIADFLSKIPKRPAWGFLPGKVIDQFIQNIGITKATIEGEFVFLETKDNLRIPGPAHRKDFLCGNFSLNRMKKKAAKLLNLDGFTDAHAALLHNLVYRMESEFSGYPYRPIRTRNLRAGDVFVDVGAFRGYVTLKASHIVGDKGKVISFEPIKENAQFVQMCQKLNELTNVDFKQEAVSTSPDKELRFFRTENQGNSEIKSHLNKEANEIVVNNRNIQDLTHLLNKLPQERIILSVTTNGTEYPLAEYLIDELSTHFKYVEVIIPIIFTMDELRKQVKESEMKNKALVEFNYPWLIFTRTEAHLKQ